MKSAIFGGTFDPIHGAHLAVAREALQQFHLDRVLFVPAGNPPHKAAGTSFEDRFRMVELACQPEPRFEASRLEAGKRKSYSIFTIEEVRASLQAGDELFFLIGADAFDELSTWFRWQDVARLVEFLVVTRPGHVIRSIPEARVRRLETIAMPVSSSEIRAELACGHAPPELPAEVLNYVRERGLYR